MTRWLKLNRIFKFINLNMSTEIPVNYHKLESILNVFKNPEHVAIKGVQELLQIYETVKSTNDKLIASGSVKRHPLIILEGLDGSGKSTVCRLFAKKIKGIAWQTPPKSIQHLRSLTDENSSLFAAYYSLGNYVAALEVEMLLKDSPVVMDRYWNSTAAFGIAQIVQKNSDSLAMPPKGDKIYCWPDDLLKPDIVIFLDVDEHIRLQRISKRKEFTAQEDLLSTCEDFRNNIMLAYRNMVDPEVIFINGNLTLESECEELLSKVKHLLYV